ncbi:MAG TPA: hypothetical protein VF406_17775 [Thermodesulfobacteriota bacterium]
MTALRRTGTVPPMTRAEPTERVVTIAAARASRLRGGKEAVR